MKKSVLILFCLLSFKVMIAQPLSGNYTINSGAVTGGTNFQSFNDFATALNTNGISASIVVTVTPGSGPYAEQFIFDNVSGTSATATVTLEGSGEKISTLTGTGNRHIMQLNNCQYFTINNFLIERDTASTSGFFGVHIVGSGNHITISNCTVNIPVTNSVLTGAYICSGNETDLLSAGSFHDITIENNTAVGGGYGASVYGLPGDLSSGIVINNNTFLDWHGNGIYLRENTGTIISNNHLDKRTSNITSCNAIQVAQQLNTNIQIFGNDIQVSQQSNGTTIMRGIYLFDGTGHKVYNNVIHNVHLTSGDYSAIVVRSAGTNSEISFNTISIDTSASTSGEIHGIEEELSNTNAIIKNNIISLTQPGPNKAAIVLGNLSTPTTDLTSDYNDLHVTNGGNIAMKGGLTPVFYPTLADWQTVSGQDANSVDADPGFISLTNSIPTNLSIDNIGTSIAGITTDILGNLRGTPPDIGAYEFEPVGIHHVSNNIKTITCFPNPAIENISMIIPDEITDRPEYSLFDATGKKVMIELRVNVSGNTINLPINQLNPGNYFLTIKNGKYQYTTEFVVMNK